MKAESLKLELIEKLMKVQKTSTLKRMEQLLTQAEMEVRAEDSLHSIDKGELFSLEEFKEDNHRWAKKNRTK